MPATISSAECKHPKMPTITGKTAGMVRQAPCPECGAVLQVWGREWRQTGIPDVDPDIAYPPDWTDEDHWPTEYTDHVFNHLVMAAMRGDFAGKMRAEKDAGIKSARARRAGARK